MKYVKKRKKLNIVFLIVSIFFGIYALSLLVPLIWGLVMSLQSRIEYITDKVSFPKVLHFENYVKAFVELQSGGNNMFSMIFNSVWWSLGTSFISVMTTLASAYVCAKYKFVGRQAMYWVSIITVMLPISGALPSRYKVFSLLGLINGPQILLSAFSIFGMHYIIAYAFFKDLSWEYAESAFLDGAGHLRVYVQIMLPMAISPAIALLLTEFIANWNDSATPLIFLPDFPTLASGFYIYQEQSGRMLDYPVLFAGLFVAAAPIIALYLIFQDTLMDLQIGSGMKG